MLNSWSSFYMLFCRHVYCNISFFSFNILLQAFNFLYQFELFSCCILWLVSSHFLIRYPWAPLHSHQNLFSLEIIINYHHLSRCIPPPSFPPSPPSTEVLLTIMYELCAWYQSPEAKENGMSVSLFCRLSEAHPQAIAALHSQVCYFKVSIPSSLLIQ